MDNAVTDVVTDIQVAEFSGIPLVKINSIPESITTGNELANVILGALAQFLPEVVHPDMMYNDN